MFMTNQIPMATQQTNCQKSNVDVMSMESCQCATTSLISGSNNYVQSSQSQKIKNKKNLPRPDKEQTGNQLLPDPGVFYQQVHCISIKHTKANPARNNTPIILNIHH